MKILVTGVLSGLGKYIYENLGGIGLTRSTAVEEFEKIKRDGVDVIIHCAFNSRKDISSDSLYQYFNDNVLLTNRLVGISHKKFIFFSTVDLYHKNSDVHVEDELINPDKVRGFYATTKLISEAIVREKCHNFLILRPTTLLGKYLRRNTLVRIIEGETEPLFLSGDSQFNYVFYSDILGFIKHSISKDSQGIFNIASTDNILLSDVVKLLGKKVVFGTHVYDVGNISNAKITALFPAFKKTSKEVVFQFAGMFENE